MTMLCPYCTFPFEMACELVSCTFFNLATMSVAHTSFCVHFCNTGNSKAKILLLAPKTLTKQKISLSQNQ